MNHLDPNAPQAVGQPVYLPVEPLPAVSAPSPQHAPQHAPQQAPQYSVAPQPAYPAPVAPVAAPLQAPLAAPEIPEWEQHVPPPAIAQAIPDHTVDARQEQFAHYQAQHQSVGGQYIPSAPVSAFPGGYAAPGALPAPQQPQTMPQPSQPMPPSGYVPQNAAPAHSFATFQGAQHPPAPPAQRPPAPAGYSPFRDDRNSYHTIIEYQGVSYFARELGDETRAFINSAGRRFIEDPAHRIVEVTHGVIQPRPIALAEVIGGEIEWYGEKLSVPEGYIYTEFPQLQGCLQVRHLDRQELSDVRLLTEEHPALFAKFMAFQERMYTEAIFQTLTGWSLPAELSLFNVNRLTLEVKRVLFMRIGAASEFGVSQDEWFQQRNNRHPQGR